MSTLKLYDYIWKWTYSNRNWNKIANSNGESNSKYISAIKKTTSPTLRRPSFFIPIFRYTYNKTTIKHKWVNLDPPLVKKNYGLSNDKESFWCKRKKIDLRAIQYFLFWIAYTGDKYARLFFPSFFHFALAKKAGKCRMEKF